MSVVVVWLSSFSLRVIVVVVAVVAVAAVAAALLKKTHTQILKKET